MFKPVHILRRLARRSDAPTLRRSDAPTLRRSDAPTLRRSDAPTLRRSDAPTLRRSDAPTLRRSDAPTLRRSDAPTLRRSDAPTLRRSDAPTLRRSDALRRTVSLNVVKAFAALLLCSPVVAHAQIITPVSASGTGTFNNSPSLIINGVFPVKGSNYQNPTNVYWTGFTPQFTIDLGQLYTVSDLNLSLDNNDNYQIQYSTNNVTYTNLIQVLSGYGTVAPSPGGMDTFSTISSSPDYVSQIDFAPVQARYLRVFAVTGGGDTEFAIGEVQAIGVSAASPEPGTLALLVPGLAMGAAGIVRRRSRRK